MTLDECAGSPYVAAFQAMTTTPHPNWPTGYPEGYGQEVFGIRSSGEVEQITHGDRVNRFDLSADAGKLYALMYPERIANWAPKDLADNTTLQVIATASPEEVLESVPAPDSADVDIAPDGRILTRRDFGGDIHAYSPDATTLDPSEAVFSIEPELGMLALNPAWSPDGALMAYTYRAADIVNGPPAQVRVRTIATGDET